MALNFFIIKLKQMNSFIKNLLITVVSIFAVVSFIRFDVYVWEWSDSGRGAFVIVSLFISLMATAMEETEPTKKVKTF
jgi:hypothetical protein